MKKAFYLLLLLGLLLCLCGCGLTPFPFSNSNESRVHKTADSFLKAWIDGNQEKMEQYALQPEKVSKFPRYESDEKYKLGEPKELDNNYYFIGCENFQYTNGLFVKETNNGFKLDLLSSFGINEMSLNTFKIKKPFESTLFYATITPSNYFPFEIRDYENTHYAFLIRDPLYLYKDLDVYIPKSQGAELFDTTMDDNLHQAILKLSMVQESTSVPIAIIDEVIAIDTWLYSDMNTANDGAISTVNNSAITNEVDMGKIETILANDGHGGQFSIYVQDLETGSEFYTANANQPFIAAGSIFPAIAYAAGKAQEQNLISFNDELRIQDYMLVGGTGILSVKDIGKSYSIMDLLSIMLMHSDNSAANILIDQMGGLAGTNRFIERTYNNTMLNRYLMDTNAINNGIENYISASEFGVSMVSFGKDGVGLLFPKADMTAYIPSSALIYHQVGVLNNVYNEVFFVSGNNSEFVLAVMSQGTNNETAKHVIGKILQSVYYDLES